MLGQLGPGRAHRARQRAGDRRARLALGRAGREAAAVAVVPAHHRLRRRSAGRAADARALARAGAPDAGELDRPLGGRARALCARRAAPTRSKSSPRGPTRSSAPSFCAIAPNHPLAAGTGRATTRRSPPSSPNAIASAPARRRSRPPRRKASTPACEALPSLRSELDAAGLCRQFRADGIWHRRDLRLPGA